MCVSLCVHMYAITRFQACHQSPVTEANTRPSKTDNLYFKTHNQCTKATVKK